LKKTKALLATLFLALLISGCAWYGVGPDGEPYLYSPWGWPYYGPWPGYYGSYPYSGTWIYGRAGYYGSSWRNNPGAVPPSAPEGYHWQYGANGWVLYPDVAETEAEVETE